jgi:hypothetical protein
LFFDVDKRNREQGSLLQWPHWDQVDLGWPGQQSAIGSPPGEKVPVS